MFVIPFRWRYNANKHEGRSVLHFVIEKMRMTSLVPKVGLEPTRLSTPAFEAGASAYFAISAYKRGSMLTITPMPGTTCTDHVLNLYWCGTRDLNPYAHKDTTTSTLPVCRFQQFRINRIWQRLALYPYLSSVTELLNLFYHLAERNTH